MEFDEVLDLALLFTLHVKATADEERGNCGLSYCVAQVLIDAL